MPLTSPFRGVLPALQVPYHEDYSIDEAELRRFVRWLAAHNGIGGLVTNGHTGEVFALRPEERAQVTRITAEEVAGQVPVISGICCESLDEAVEHSLQAKSAGAQGLLVMPPHYWLRFGMKPEHVIEHFTEIGNAVQINLIVHIYPAWTRASYSSELLAELARLPWVTTFKIGTREMSQYDRDILAIRAAAPEKSILTCHDEYLLPTMVQGVDGALVGFASFIPELITALYAAVCDGDLRKAQALQSRIYGLKSVVYAAGEPSGEAHARMKAAMVMAGRFKSDRTRPPIRPPQGELRERIRAAVEVAQLDPSSALVDG
ncbi:MAG TPA: dihydrodipicolinate synthase family protein [Bryobacteraceae bacterium]|nr:dihydrodipicolinate synthase family protein [Bryobacterales bacterium]HRJ18169.1 dihydrodipicolinate synthase family protein [Bryobacteraceae bacterium]